MLYLPVALNPKEMVGSMFLACLMPSKIISKSKVTTYRKFWDVQTNQPTNQTRFYISRDVDEEILCLNLIFVLLFWLYLFLLLPD